MKTLAGLVLITATIFAEGTAFADWDDDFFADFHQTYQRRVCWPEPFTCVDRQIACQPFVGMVARGWELENMLADHHFVEGTSQLTEAGRLKIQRILADVPLQHRIIYVHRALRPAETAARMVAVRQAAGQLLGAGEMVAVLETSASPPSAPADLIELTQRKARAVVPDPKLPGAVGGNGPAGGGAGGGGGNGAAPGGGTAAQ